MKLNLLTYADEKYFDIQNNLIEHSILSGVFNHVITKRREDLIQTDFYKENQYILDNPIGGGFCLWKPYYILEELKKMQDGDLLLYMDCADWIYNGGELREFAFKVMEDKDLLLTSGAYPNYMYTKRDCFFYMGCDTPEYHNAIQLEAGIILIKKNQESINFIKRWFNFCKNPAIITNDPNTCGLPNLDGFVDIRYDQSSLSLLAQKEGIPQSNEIRYFITCNVNMPTN